MKKDLHCADSLLLDGRGVFPEYEFGRELEKFRVTLDSEVLLEDNINLATSRTDRTVI